MGIILSIPIGIIYNLIVSKIGNMMTQDSSYRDKIKKNLIVEIIGGIVALALAYFVFSSELFNNKIAKWGLIFGGILLLIYSLVYNWDEIDDFVKLFLFLSAFTGTVVYSYNYIKIKNKKHE
jgi:undecaprenyl pyrophosphate phosphatase UppP